MNVRTIVSAILLLAAGCGRDNSAETPATTGEAKPAPSIALVFDETWRGDEGMSDSAATGLARAATEFGVDTREIKTESASEYESTLENLAVEKADLIIGIGFGMDDAAHEAAAANPQQKFAIVDAASRAPNVLGIEFKMEEGSFLAGLLAGMTTKTNKIGFAGGKIGPDTERFEAGFRAGVRTANRNAIVTAKYTEDRSDIQEGKEVALSLFDAGADIVFHTGGGGGMGVIDAAHERGKLAICVGSDQDGISPGSVLSTVVKSVDKAVFDVVRMLKDGTFKGRTLELGAKEGYIALSEPKEYTMPLMPPNAMETIAEARKMIADRALIVPKNEIELERFRVPLLAGLQ